MGETFAPGCGTAAGVKPFGLEPASRQGQSQGKLLVGEGLVPTSTTQFIRRGRSDIEKVVLAGLHQNPGGCAKRQSTLQQVISRPHVQQIELSQEFSEKSYLPAQGGAAAAGLRGGINE